MREGLLFRHTSSKQAATCCSRLWNITRLLKRIGVFTGPEGQYHI